MATTTETKVSISDLWDILRPIEQSQEHIADIRYKSFEILREYCKLKKSDKLREENLNAVCGAALKLSNIVQKGLSGAVYRFLQENEKKLPHRASNMLRTNLLRMEGV